MPKWTEEQIKILVDNYHDHDVNELSEMIGRNRQSVNNKAFQMRLKKTPEHIKKMLNKSIDLMVKKGTVTAFKKGNKPWNKGTKGVMKANKASYKKGKIPKSYHEPGTISINKEGYKIQKLEDGRWVRTQVLAWEKVHGPIPEGYILRLKNKDIDCVDVNNMFLVTRSENLELNTVHRYPKELINTIKLLNKLKKKTNEKQD